MAHQSSVRLIVPVLRVRDIGVRLMVMGRVMVRVRVRVRVRVSVCACED